MFNFAKEVKRVRKDKGLSVQTKPVPVYALTAAGKEAVYPDIDAASRAMGIGIPIISAACKSGGSTTVKGFEMIHEVNEICNVCKQDSPDFECTVPGCVFAYHFKCAGEATKPTDATWMCICCAKLSAKFIQVSTITKDALGRRAAAAKANAGGGVAGGKSAKDTWDVLAQGSQRTVNDRKDYEVVQLKKRTEAEAASKLEKGTRVQVPKVGPRGETCFGIVHYVGPHKKYPDAKGIRVLVELDRAWGKNDGIVDGFKYTRDGALCLFFRTVRSIVLVLVLEEVACCVCTSLANRV